MIVTHYESSKLWGNIFVRLWRELVDFQDIKDK